MGCLYTKLWGFWMRREMAEGGRGGRVEEQ